MDEPLTDEPEKIPSPEAIRRRRRWLIAFVGLAAATIVSVVAVQLFAGDDEKKQRDRALDDSARSVVLERFDLEPRRGKSRRGLAELVRRDGETYSPDDRRRTAPELRRRGLPGRPGRQERPETAGQPEGRLEGAFPRADADEQRAAACLRSHRTAPRRVRYE